MIFGFLCCGCSYFVDERDEYVSRLGNVYIQSFKPKLSKEQVEKLLASGNYPNEIKAITVSNMDKAVSAYVSLVNEYGCIFIGSSPAQRTLSKKDNPEVAARRIGANTYIDFVVYSHKEIDNTSSSNYSFSYFSSKSTSSHSSESYYTNKYHLVEADFFLCD